mmetsp:Transcript_16835/g.34074  ORF Transcript_16835/g.34074 Transcript_16835/m.34074 type:complete len:364 (+) Transcript_16835:71-1162(+)
MRLVGEINSASNRRLRVLRWFRRAQSRLLKGRCAERRHVVTVALLVCWYLTAILANITNKTIMSRYNHPSFLVLLQILANLLLNSAYLARYEPKGAITRLKRAAPLCFPCAVTLVVSRTLTYFSFSKVPASLTQTVKASTPVFAVVVAYLLNGRRTNFKTLLTLVPIIVGVALSAVTELKFEIAGFVSAVLAAFISTLQSFATKNFLRETGASASPMVFNLVVSIMASVVLLPVNVFQMWKHTEGDAPLDGTLALFFLASVMTNWLQTVCSIFVLKRLSILSHQVTSVLRRLVIIVSSLIYFQNEVTHLKILGIVTAIGGFAWYGWTEKMKRKKAVTPVHADTVNYQKGNGCFSDPNNKLLIV